MLGPATGCHKLRGKANVPNLRGMTVAKRTAEQRQRHRSSSPPSSEPVWRPSACRPLQLHALLLCAGRRSYWFRARRRATSVRLHNDSSMMRGSLPTRRSGWHSLLSLMTICGMRGRESSVALVIASWRSGPAATPHGLSRERASSRCSCGDVGRYRLTLPVPPRGFGSFAVEPP
jgi:hypothetical protein